MDLGAMNVRPATVADVPRIRALFVAAHAAGTFGEWRAPGGPDIREDSENDAHDDIARDDRELWAAYDDAGALRGYVRCTLSGSEAGTEVWKLALGVFDPALTGRTFQRLYFGACLAAVLAHPDAIWEGSVVAGSASDRMWQARLPADARSERNVHGIREAYYQMPGRAFLATF
ncbi:MAG: hypothetical protein ACYDHE_17060 [Candidatus Acidiferrales bacterium]